MSNTYRHVEHAKLRKEQRSDPLRHYPQPSINNQVQPYYGPPMASDLKIDIRSWDCTVAMRSIHGGRKLRRIRRGARRALRSNSIVKSYQTTNFRCPISPNPTNTPACTSGLVQVIGA
jgi:hypothetical protein